MQLWQGRANLLQLAQTAWELKPAGFPFQLHFHHKKTWNSKKTKFLTIFTLWSTWKFYQGFILQLCFQPFEGTSVLFIIPKKSQFQSDALILQILDNNLKNIAWWAAYDILQNHLRNFYNSINRIYLSKKINLFFNNYYWILIIKEIFSSNVHDFIDICLAVRREIERKVKVDEGKFQ